MCLEGSEGKVDRGGSVHCTETGGWAGKEHLVSKHAPWEEGCILKGGDNELLWAAGIQLQVCQRDVAQSGLGQAEGFMAQLQGTSSDSSCLLARTKCFYRHWLHGSG